MSLKHKVVSGALWTAAGGWSSQLFLALLFVFVARILGPEDFGAFAIVGVVLGLAQILVNPGFSQAIVSLDQISDDVASSVFWATVMSSIILALLLFVATVVMPGDIVPAYLAALLLASLPVLVIGAAAIVPQALLTRELRYREITLATTFGNVLGGLVALAMALLGYGVWALVAQQYAVAITSLLLLTRYGRWRPGTRMRVAHIAPVVREGGHYFGIGLLTYANRRLDNALVGYLFGVAALGVYVIAKRIFNLLADLVTQPFTRVALSALSRVKGDSGATKNAFLRMAGFTSLVTAPVFAGALLLAPDLMMLAFGEKWRDATPLFQVFCIAGMVRGASLYTVPLLTVLNRGRTALLLHLANTVANFIAYLLFMPFGLVGIAMGFSVRAVLFQLVTFVVIRAVAGIRLMTMLRNLLPAYGTTVMMALLVYAMVSLMDRPLAWPNLALAIIAGAVSYAVFSYFLARANFEEIRSMVKTYLS